MQELKLTAEQSAEIEQIIQASRGAADGDKEDLDRAQSDFRQLMERPDSEPSASCSRPPSASRWRGIPSPRSGR